MLNLTKIIYISILLGLYIQLNAQTNVTATIDATARTASMSNGIISITINSKGQVNSLFYNSKDLVDAANGGRFYFSLNDQVGYKELSPVSLRIEKQNDDYAEVVYSNPGGGIILEQGYILSKGVSGIYSYVTVKGTSTVTTLREMRLVYRVSPSLFTYGYVSDRMQGVLPSVEVMAAVDATPVMDATYQLPDGTIYTKYNWANYIAQDSVHGIISASEGVWAIPVSHEYVNGGPMKQELTVHTTNKTPLVLQMLQGEHMGAAAQTYIAGDEKIYGPFFIYINSGSSHEVMIEDAKQQASIQKSQWPFQWLTNSLYPHDRSKVTGNINVYAGLPKKNIQVVLALPGSDFYDQGKQYMFWGLTDDNGNFSIDHVRKGTYTLYAYATEGEITEELAVDNIVVSNANTPLGTIEWHPVKYENLLWRIGENDRNTAGFKLSDTVRQYGLYELPPVNLNFIIGTNTHQNDWYYAQTKLGTWTITFNTNSNYTGNAMLTASIAGSATTPKVDVYVNGSKRATWSFTNDASIYRSAVLGGRHTLKTLTFPASLLVNWNNTIAFKMTSVGSRGGVMYDCIKLETGDVFTNTPILNNKRNTISVSNYPNPFGSMTTICLNMPASENVSIQIFNQDGKRIKTIFNGLLSEGKHQFEWFPANLPSGIYFCRVKSNHKALLKKLVFVRP